MERPSAGAIGSGHGSLPLLGPAAALAAQLRGAYQGLSAGADAHHHQQQQQEQPPLSSPKAGDGGAAKK